MDPSGAQANVVGFNVSSTTSIPKGPPTTAAIDNRSQQSPRAPIPEDVDSGNGPGCGLQPSDDRFREQKAEESIEKTKEQRGWRKVIRNFTPS